MRVSCSACADWPRALQKHKQHATRNNPGVILHAGSPVQQVTLSHDAERQLTREKLLHTHSACRSTAARAYSSEKHAPLQSAKRKQLTSGPNFFWGFGRGSSTNQVRDLKITLSLLFAPDDRTHLRYHFRCEDRRINRSNHAHCTGQSVSS